MSTPIFHDARFDALRNAIYHTERAKFLDFLNRGANFAVIVLGAAAFGKLVAQHQGVGTWLEFGIVLIATLQLVFDFGGRAGTHTFLQKRYYDLLAEMEITRDIDSDSAKKKWSSRLLTIAGDEPMTMRALDALAYNQALDAWTYDSAILYAHRVYVPWWKRRLRHLWAFQGSQFAPKLQTNLATDKNHPTTDEQPNGKGS